MNAATECSLTFAIIKTAQRNLENDRYLNQLRIEVLKSLKAA